MKEFTPFRLDTINQCLWRRRENTKAERIPLTPKAFAVLQYLVEHPGRLVTHSEILDALWPDTYVQPEVLKNQLLDVRRALGDNAKAPHFIETLPRRGYQFIAGVSEGTSTPSPAPIKPTVAKLVGRDRPLRESHDCLASAIQGHRQIQFVTGEAGIGKTALVDQFLCQASGQISSIRLARGQCLEGYGSKEAYYPMLETLGQLCRGPGGDSVVQILSVQAPSWLAQFPALLKREDRQALQREILGATRERMLREIEDAIEPMTAETPLLLVFEDLQWVDPATVDLISALARGRRPAKLMLLATYRSVFSDHPLKAVIQELLLHQLCQEIVLEPLSENEIAEYLVSDSEAADLPEGLAELVHRHSEGNPLFMVAALEHMTERGMITRAKGSWQLRVPLEDIDPGVPESLRKMIEAQIDGLTAAEQRALEVASVTGARFSTSVCAAAADLSPEVFEERCEELSRRNLLVRWVDSQHLPDGSSCQRFEFVHALYRDVFYRRLAAGRRAKLHLRIGLRLEELFPNQLSDLAPELAHHFEAGSDWGRAVQYHVLVAETARRRYAHREAAAVLEHALELLSRLPEEKRSMSDIEILEKLAATYVVLFDPRTIETYEALAARAAQMGLIDVEVRALIDLALPLASISSQRYLEVLERALRLSAGQRDPILRATARATCLVRRMVAAGWNPMDAEESRKCLESIRHAGNHNILASCLIDCSFIQSLSSEYREAYRSATESIGLLVAGCEENPYLSVAYWLTHRSLLFLGEWGEALREIEAAIARVEKNGDHYRLHTLRLYRAWVHFHAMDFKGVLAICESELPSLSLIRSLSGMRLCLVLAGSAEAALGSHARALQHLLTAREGMDREVVIFDWYWRIPLESALTEVWLNQQDLAQARPQAERFLQATLATAERTWQALAWEANARVARAERDAERAQACISKALTILEGFELPLAAWRIHATAADLADSRGQASLAAHHRRFSRDTILKLANSLPANSPLREAFLSAPCTSSVLGRA